VPETSHWVFIKDDQAHRVPVQAAIAVNDSVAAKQLVMRHSGIAMLQDFAVKQELASGELLPLLRQYRSPEVPIYVVYPERKHLSPKLRAMVDFLVALFENPML
jgi:DNA-binding transcriptional LysR family regulator